MIVTDGERALQRRVGTIFGDVTLVLDLLHVVQKLWAAAYVFHPEGSPEATDFVRDRTLRILSGHVSGVVQGLRQMVTKRQLKGAKAQTVMAVASYYYAGTGCATTNTWPTGGPSPAARWRAPAKIWSGTASSAPACAGRHPWQKPCSNCEPSTYPATTTPTGNGTSQRDQQRLYPKEHWQAVAQK